MSLSHLSVHGDGETIECVSHPIPHLHTLHTRRPASQQASHRPSKTLTSSDPADRCITRAMQNTGKRCIACHLGASVGLLTQCRPTHCPVTHHTLMTDTRPLLPPLSPSTWPANNRRAPVPHSDLPVASSSVSRHHSGSITHSPSLSLPLLCGREGHSISWMGWIAHRTREPRDHRGRMAARPTRIM